MDSCRFGLPSQTSSTINKLDISTFKFGYPRLTLKGGPKDKSDHIKRFPAHDLLQVGLPSQTSRTNNKRVISIFKFGYPRLTLKGGPKVKSDHTRRFPVHDFLCVGLPSQTSRTNKEYMCFRWIQSNWFNAYWMYCPNIPHAPFPSHFSMLIFGCVVVWGT